jgi:predicted aconitase with swiveling domain
MNATLLLPAEPTRAVTGTALHLLEPISFWGGVSPESGRLLEPSNPAHGLSVAGRVLLIRQLRGSSSASSVLLELIHAGAAPAAIILAEVDAILALGILVAQEMGWSAPPLLQLDSAEQARIPGDAVVTVAPDGTLEVTG